MPLNTKQLIAAGQIALGATHKQAAQKAQVTPCTISEWMRNPEFKATINEIQRSILHDAQARFRGLAFSAVDALADIINTSKNDKLRLEAAKYILETIKIAPGKEFGLWYITVNNTEDMY